MDQQLIHLVMIAGLFVLGALGEMIFARTQVPDVVWLIGAGVLLNATGLVDPDSLDSVLPLFAALTLIIVLFEGGSQLVVHQLIRAAPRASALALFAFIFATSFVAALTMAGAQIGLMPEDWTLTHGLMVGAMLGGSSSLIVMPSMTVAKVEEKVANLVGLESALTDALCVVVTVAMIDIIVSGRASASETSIVLAKNFGIALGVGVAAGWMWMPVLRLLRGNSHAYPVTLAALIFLYVLVDSAGGSAAMAILAFAVMVGNAAALMRAVGFSSGDSPLALDESVRTVHTQISFIIKSFFFTFIGLKLSPPWPALFFGVVVGVGLVVARLPAIWIAIRPGKAFDADQEKLITISMPRGMAAGVLATMPMQAGIEGLEDLPSMVFSAVVTSIVLFAGGFRAIRSADAAHAEQAASTDSDPQSPPAEEEVVREEASLPTQEPELTAPVPEEPSSPEKTASQDDLSDGEAQPEDSMPEPADGSGSPAEVGSPRPAPEAPSKGADFETPSQPS